MDLSSPIIYNGLTIDAPSSSAGGVPASGFQVEQVNISPVAVAEFLEKAALRDGMDAGDVFSAARTISIAAGVYGSTPGDLWDNVQAWLAAFNPVLALAADTANLGFIPLDFTQPTMLSAWSATGIPMRLYARPSASPTYVVDRNAQGTRFAAKGSSIRVNASLICRDPRKYLQTAQSLTIASTGTTATHRGDYPTFPTIQIDVNSSSGHPAYKVVIGSSTATLDLSADTTKVFTLDFATRSITDANGNLRLDILTSTAFDWPQIQPDSATVISHDLVTSPAPTVTATYREAWA